MTNKILFFGLYQLDFFVPIKSWIYSIIKFDIWYSNSLTVDIVRVHENTTMRHADSCTSNCDCRTCPCASALEQVQCCKRQPSIVHKKTKKRDEGETNGAIRRFKYQRASRSNMF